MLDTALKGFILIFSLCRFTLNSVLRVSVSYLVQCTMAASLMKDRAQEKKITFQIICTLWVVSEALKIICN